MMLLLLLEGHAQREKGVLSAFAIFSIAFLNLDSPKTLEATPIDTDKGPGSIVPGRLVHGARQGGGRPLCVNDSPDG